MSAWLRYWQSICRAAIRISICVLPASSIFSQRIALEMKLSSKHIDDLRVAALMQGFSKIEVTTKVISKAVHSLEAQRDANDFSFHGTDLVYSLGIVLRGAIPILLGQDEVLSAQLPVQMTTEPPIGASILSIVRSVFGDDYGSAGWRTSLLLRRSGNFVPPERRRSIWRFSMRSSAW